MPTPFLQVGKSGGGIQLNTVSKLGSDLPLTYKGLKGTVMAHQLEHSKSMAYVGETPWHGLGVEVEKGISVEGMLKASSLDWKVDKRRVYVRKSRTEKGIMEIPKQYAIMRDFDHKHYGFCSDRYNLVQNSEVLGFFKEYVEAGGMEMSTAGSLKEGGVIWAMASIGDSFTLAGGDKVTGNMLLANSHDGSMSYVGMFTSVRVVCMNTLSMAISEQGQAMKNGQSRMFKIKHSKKLTKEVMENAKKTLGLAKEQLSRLSDWSGILAGSKVKDTQHVLSFIATLTNSDLSGIGVGEKENEEIIITADGRAIVKDGQRDIREEDLNRAGQSILASIVDSPGSQLASAKGTWWGVLNGVTHYVDYEAGRGRDTALSSAWFGSGNAMKQDAARLAMEYASK